MPCFQSDIILAYAYEHMRMKSQPLIQLPQFLVGQSGMNVR